MTGLRVTLSTGTSKVVYREIVSHATKKQAKVGEKLPGAFLSCRECFPVLDEARRSHRDTSLPKERGRPSGLST